MGNILNYIWSNRLFPKDGIYTTGGKKLQVIYTGENNAGEENVFCNARIKIDGCTWSGNVVIHDKSSDWEKDIKEKGKIAYTNAILHVTGNDDIETLHPHGESVPQLRLRYPHDLADEYNSTLENNRLLPCNGAIGNMPIVQLHNFMSRLMIERVEEKARQIYSLHQECNQKWDETLFKQLSRNFGFGIQGETFRQWASLLDYGALCKHRNNLTQIEAMFFGQAGLLNEECIPLYYRNDALKSDYYNELLREYRFLAGKFNLAAMDGRKWNCGNSTPHIRIARLAALFHSEKINISTMASLNTITELRDVLRSNLNGYWHNHIQFGSTETAGNSQQRDTQLDLLIINTVVPILYLYGKHRKDIAICEKAENYLHNINGENNSITRKWAMMGVTTNCAADSQAIIQLQKAYCNKAKCQDCHFAYAYIKERIGA